jgi:hypothetical protein
MIQALPVTLPRALVLMRKADRLLLVLTRRKPEITLRELN